MLAKRIIPCLDVKDGVVVKGKNGIETITAKGGVVLATGGYSANQAMVTQYCGSAAANMPIRGARFIAGENILLTQKVFAKDVNVNQYHCGPIYGPTGANPLNIVKVDIVNCDIGFYRHTV